MGVDIRVGRKDYYTKYKVYSSDADIRNSVTISNYFKGILHAKDISSYNTSNNMIAGKFQRTEVNATIETQDRIDIQPDDFLYCIPEHQWYRVESAAPDSHNETQRWSSRPVNTTQIVITRTN